MGQLLLKMELQDLKKKVYDNLKNYTQALNLVKSGLTFKFTK